MKTQIIKTRHPLLKNLVQYFIFFSSDEQMAVNYTTFPNTNLCLAIYRQNDLYFQLDRSANKCWISPGKSNYQSQLLGFHKKAFEVNVKAPLDQICILFQPSGLRSFSDVPYRELQQGNEAFQRIMGDCDPFFLELLFQEKNMQKRALLLEQLLLQKLRKGSAPHRIKMILHGLDNKKGPRTVGEVAKEHSMSESTLYRLFVDEIGQGPKAYLRTLRFRNILNDLLINDHVKLSHVAYDNKYADQAHFIKDFRALSGESPKGLMSRALVEQEELAWVYSEECA